MNSNEAMTAIVPPIIATVALSIRKQRTYATQAENETKLVVISPRMNKYRPEDAPMKKLYHHHL